MHQQVFLKGHIAFVTYYKAICYMVYDKNSIKELKTTYSIEYQWVGNIVIFTEF